MPLKSSQVLSASVFGHQIIEQLSRPINPSLLAGPLSLANVGQVTHPVTAAALGLGLLGLTPGFGSEDGDHGYANHQRSDQCCHGRTPTRPRLHSLPDAGPARPNRLPSQPALEIIGYCAGRSVSVGRILPHAL